MSELPVLRTVSVEIGGGLAVLHAAAPRLVIYQTATVRARMLYRQGMFEIMRILDRSIVC